MDYTEVKDSLKTKGYAIIENCISSEQVALAKQYFGDWLLSNSELVEKHMKIDPHGIFKFGEVGHQRHAWYISSSTV